ncbi:MAG: hypothetical protein GX058_07320 [Firmicutes bacterium]|nr:hypothetical protein [Bacillota bacterium]
MSEPIKIIEVLPLPEPSRFRTRSTQFLRMVKMAVSRVRRGHPELEGTSLYDIGIRKIPAEGKLEVTLYFRPDQVNEKTGA